MPQYLQGSALLAACAAGRGVIIVVEGETDEKDAWFYRQWFGRRATEVSFIPQNGWTKVTQAVNDLRVQLPMRHIFGIIDRDHTPDLLIVAQETACPSDGVFRTERFTLENYLLEPELLFSFVCQMNRGNPPLLMPSLADAEQIVLAEYNRCIPLAAYNLSLRREHDRLGTHGIPAAVHPDAMPSDPEAALAMIQTSNSSPLDLAEIYRNHVSRLTGQPISVLRRYITGKVVFKLVLPRLPLSLPSISPEKLQTLLITHNPTPPQDLEDLISRIVDRSGQP